MDSHRYQTLVKSLEVDSTINPGAFRSKVILISSVAYVVLFSLLGAMALLIYVGITTAYSKHQTGTLIRIGFFALVMTPVFFVVLRAFLARLPAPEGRRLTQSEAPKLFSVLDKMRKHLKGPPIHHVLINEDYNAAISQRPRFGLFGGHTNYLILGLPYLLGVSPKEMLATVAHEYGHLCGSHGKVGAWIYRQRRTFGALHEKISASAEDNFVHGVMAGMLNKFAPYYNAYTFVLSRQQEYEADRTATELTSASANARGLIRDELLGRWVHEDFWPKLYKQADTNAKPAVLPYGVMRTAFDANYAEWATQERLYAAWQKTSGLHDTHPCLRDRVEALGEPAALPGRLETTAAETLLGPTAKTLIEEFDKGWWEREKNEWNSRYQYVTRSQARLQELARQSLSEMKPQDLQEYALLSAEFDTPQAAKNVLEHLLRQPGGPFPRAEYEYGCLLIAEDNKTGLDHLATAAKADRSLLEPAARAGYTYLMNKHGEDQAQQWWERIVPRESED